MDKKARSHTFYRRFVLIAPLCAGVFVQVPSSLFVNLLKTDVISGELHHHGLHVVFVVVVVDYLDGTEAVLDVALVCSRGTFAVVVRM